MAQIHGHITYSITLKFPRHCQTHLHNRCPPPQLHSTKKGCIENKDVVEPVISLPPYMLKQRSNKKIRTDLTSGQKNPNSQIQFIIIQIHITFNPFKWIYLKLKSIFLDFKFNPFNWIWIIYKLDTFLDYPK